MRRLFWVLLALVALMSMATAQTVRVGSKKFTESYVLGEIAKRVLTDAGFEVEHKQGMGATAIVWNGLTGGSIDAYPEYTGTVSEELLKKPGLTPEQMRTELAKSGIGMTDELGFNNTYGLVMRRADAEKRGITKISDLKGHPEIRCGITHELLGRKDGWAPLVAKYGLRFDNVKGIDHALGYTALASNEVDLKDCYTTDAEIKRYDLRVLKDDLGYFPLYRAVFLYRLTMPEKAVAALNSLAGKIDEPKMIALNEEAGRTKDYTAAAATFFHSSSPVSSPKSDVAGKIVRLLGQHLLLVGVSLLIAIVVGVPLGIVAARPGWLGGAILGTAGVIQTIPSLALLALLVAVPGLGISFQTAVIALFLYSLLPIVRNTAAGLSGIPAPLRESATALGLEPSARLRQIYLPLALPTILAGVKTSAVINVGTATLAAFMGVGGLGEPIVSGLSLNDTGTILQGAIPAAVLALVVQGVFDLLEKAMVPRGIRREATGHEA